MIAVNHQASRQAQSCLCLCCCRWWGCACSEPVAQLEARLWGQRARDGRQGPYEEESFQFLLKASALQRASEKQHRSISCRTKEPRCHNRWPLGADLSLLHLFPPFFRLRVLRRVLVLLFLVVLGLQVVAAASAASETVFLGFTSGA